MIYNFFHTLSLNLRTLLTNTNYCSEADFLSSNKLKIRLIPKF